MCCCCTWRAMSAPEDHRSENANAGLLLRGVHRSRAISLSRFRAVVAVTQLALVAGDSMPASSRARR
jgi:hypothetical protein